MLSIYNTLTNKKEIFEPINPPEVMMYVCGPTVYDYFHIGNARSFVMADVVRRYLLYRGYKVKFLMNLTDVDDKIIKRSREQNEDFNQFAEKYITAFFDDLEKLNRRAKRRVSFCISTRALARVSLPSTTGLMWR